MPSIELTRSELMALRDIVAHYLIIPTHSEVFVDCSERPAIETTPEQLLARLMGVTRRARPAPVNAYHDHLDACTQCRDNPFGLCDTGKQLLRGATDASDRP